MLDVLRISRNAYEIGKGMTARALEQDLIRQSAVMYQIIPIP